MLTELEGAHSELLDLIAQLEAMTGHDAPDRDALAGIRWKLSRASGRRLKLLEKDIYPALLALAIEEEARSVANLRDGYPPVFAASRRHVAAWSIEAVMADWPGYCRASAEMREQMRMRIGMEQALLYPLLARYDEGLAAAFGDQAPRARRQAGGR